MVQKHSSVAVLFWEDIADKLLHIFELRERTDGRNRIIQSGLDLSDIARRIQTIYEDVYKIHARK